jgi:hypothetical protein
MTTKVSVDDLCCFHSQGCGFDRRLVQHLNLKEPSELLGLFTENYTQAFDQLGLQQFAS